MIWSDLRGTHLSALIESHHYSMKVMFILEFGINKKNKWLDKWSGMSIVMEVLILLYLNIGIYMNHI